MKVRIVNNCRETYRPDPENIVKHMLERIPEKFVEGPGEIRLFDAPKDPKQESGIQYVRKTRRTPYAVIEIFMDSMLSGTPFFSIFIFNLFFIFAMNDHIKMYLKPCSHDQEILSYPVGRVPYKWMYFGLWNPILIIVKAVHYVIYCNPLFQRMTWDFVRNRFLKIQDRKKG